MKYTARPMVKRTNPSKGKPAGVVVGGGDVLVVPVVGVVVVVVVVVPVVSVVVLVVLVDSVVVLVDSVVVPVVDVGSAVMASILAAGVLVVAMVVGTEVDLALVDEGVSVLGDFVFVACDRVTSIGVFCEWDCPEPPTAPVVSGSAVAERGSPMATTTKDMTTAKAPIPLCH